MKLIKFIILNLLCIILLTSCIHKKQEPMRVFWGEKGDVEAIQKAVDEVMMNYNWVVKDVDYETNEEE